MNILIPDSWLREHLKTKATAKQIKEYLSLCGPSVERINEVEGNLVYDIEVTGNRPDMLSVTGIARETAAILPRFGIKVEFVGDPYTQDLILPTERSDPKLNAVVDSKLCPRFTAIVLDNIKVAPSPDWLKKRLELIGLRCINNVIDVTNYLMHLYGQPVHAFDFNEIKANKSGIPTMILRESKKGEILTTLDGKTHKLPGEDIVIEDGSGRLIDLCGIMGGASSAIKEETSQILLFVQTYDPAHIRKTVMALVHRTEAASLFEKGTDSELVLPTLIKGVELIRDLAGGRLASQLYDIYPKPYQSIKVNVSRPKITKYLGIELAHSEIENILKPLGFNVDTKSQLINVKIPSFRRDVNGDVDIIEELARIYGYHKLPTKLPEGELPNVAPDKTLDWEEEIKVRLRDWGFTELYTYSMISEKLMALFELDKTHAYKIANPLSEEWVYLRPHLTPSILLAIKQNLNLNLQLKIFELSMTYEYRNNNLPLEKPALIVAWAGRKFSEAKGLAQAIFELFGIDFPETLNNPAKPRARYDQIVFDNAYLSLGDFGSIGEIKQEILANLEIDKSITRLYLNFNQLVAHANPIKKYIPIPKFPPIIEDLAFILPAQTPIGPLIAVFKQVHPIIEDITLLDSFGDTRTLRITYRDLNKNLNDNDVRPIREKLISLAKEQFNANLKTI